MGTRSVKPGHQHTARGLWAENPKKSARCSWPAEGAATFHVALARVQSPSHPVGCRPRLLEPSKAGDAASPGESSSSGKQGRPRQPRPPNPRDSFSLVSPQSCSLCCQPRSESAVSPTPGAVGTQRVELCSVLGVFPGRGRGRGRAGRRRLLRAPSKPPGPGGRWTPHQSKPPSCPSHPIPAASAPLTGRSPLRTLLSVPVMGCCVRLATCPRFSC